MTQIAYRANLDSKHYPFLSQSHGRTVIVPGKDQAFSNSQKVQVAGQNEDKDIGIPQIYYCHNVMPSDDGLQSVGITTRLAGMPGSTDFNDIFVLRDSSENKFLYSPANNRNYIYDATVAAWGPHTGFNIPSNSTVTVAYIAGNTYIFFQGLGLYQYNITTKALDAVTMIGVTASLLHGVTASNGFLIAWDGFNVYRSQSSNPLNFTPDPTLGSGSSIPDDIKGQIVVCLPITNGFIIYTTKNAVGASFSQNVRYPFIYKEITGSAGIISASHVAWQNNDGHHYAWTLAGLQKFDRSIATVVFPEVSDFLASRVFEDFDSTLNAFIVSRLTANMVVKMAFVGKRFLVISYGITNFTHALVYDVTYARWGKIKLTHVACFEYNIPNLFGDITWAMLGTLTWADLGLTTWADLSTQLQTFEAPKETLAFLQQDGTIKTVTFDVAHITDDLGVLVLGKYQFVRERFLCLDEINIECVTIGSPFSAIILTTIDGKTFRPATVPYLSITSDDYRQYLTNVEGRNHTIVFKGTFDMVCIELKFHPTSHA